MLNIFHEFRAGVKIYRFRRKVDGKFKRLDQSLHPVFTSRESAEEWRRQQSASELAMRDRVLQRVAWKSKFFDFGKLRHEFEQYYRNEAPNTYRTACGILDQYVFHYYLDVAKIYNINLWPDQFNSFKKWLGQQTSPRAAVMPLAKATQNNVINILNAFLKWCQEEGKISQETLRKCRAHPESDLNFRGIEDVIAPDEAKVIVPKIADMYPPAAEFFRVLLGTGMRFNELRSLPMSYMFAGHLDADDPLHKELQSQGISYYGYIVLQSQADFRRSKDAPHLIRKPLKGRRTMSLKDARTIPIIDLEVFNILARRCEEAEKALESGTKGTEPIAYLLFPELETSKAYSALLKAYIQAGKSPKQYHCTRHTYVTYMVGRTRSFFLVRAITGHKSRAFERYLHTFEEIAAKAKANATPVRVISLTKDEPKTMTAWKWS